MKEYHKKYSSSEREAWEERGMHGGDKECFNKNKEKDREYNRE